MWWCDEKTMEEFVAFLRLQFHLWLSHVTRYCAFWNAPWAIHLKHPQYHVRDNGGIFEISIPSLIVSCHTVLRFLEYTRGNTSQAPQYHVLKHQNHHRALSSKVQHKNSCNGGIMASSSSSSKSCVTASIPSGIPVCYWQWLPLSTERLGMLFDTEFQWYFLPSGFKLVEDTCGLLR